MKKIRVLLADDHSIVRQGLRAILDQTEDVEVVAEARDGMEAVKKTKKFLPDIVLIDIGMPVLNGIEATRQIKKRFPAVKVLVLTMHTTEEYILQVLHAGASGYIVKMSAAQELLEAIRAVYQGHFFLSPSVSQKVVGEYIQRTKDMIELDIMDVLTTREREVLQLIAEGRSNKEIAGLLFISVKTVETHKAHLMQKLELHTTTDLVKFAIKKGIISQE
ncbi:MAG: response regulator transcription factor [Candidatus Aminicenantes bacterium]|nr:response regulator transcription factor [Candidatus Aminicenantes bacterium]